MYKKVSKQENGHHQSIPPPSSDMSRTQYKLQLQRLSFLTNDKNYLDHPQNMKRLTKELDRVEREYRNVRKYEDPLKQSFQRLLEHKRSATAMSIPSRKSSMSTINKNSNSSSYDSNESYSSSGEKFGFLTKWFTTHGAPNSAPIPHNNHYHY